MESVTWKQWCEIKKARDKAIEEEAKQLTIKKCSCGIWYSYKESIQLDPGMCGECRYGSE
jgi:hypothetical protein